MTIEYTKREDRGNSDSGANGRFLVPPTTPPVG